LALSSMTKLKSLPQVYSAKDHQDAGRLLRVARDLLTEGETPFPLLEAAHQGGVRTDSSAWALAAQAREMAGRPSDDHQLEAAAALVRNDKRISRKACSPRLTRVPRCRLRASGGRCGRPIAHKRDCSLEPPPDDLVRSIGTDHVLVGGPPTDTTMIAAWADGATGRALRVRRDDHDRGLWFDSPQRQRPKSGGPLLLEWNEVRRLVLDLNLELADCRNQPPAGSRAIKRQEKKSLGI